MSDSAGTSALLKGKIKPHNLEAEMAILGALMLDNAAIGTVRAILTSDSFYSRKHKEIYQALSELYTSGENPDILILTDYLRSKNMLETVGGAGYIASLTDSVPSTANVEYYARIVLDAAIRRSLIDNSHKILADVYDESIPSRELLDEAQKKIFELTDAGNSATFKKIGEIIMPVIQHLEQIKTAGKDITGIPSGFDSLDAMTFGFQNSEFIILGARPSMGKTAFAMTVAANIAIRSKIPTAFFSLEMGEEQLVQRLIASEAKIDSKKMRSADLTLQDYSKIMDTCGRMYESPMYIVEMPNMKLLDLRAMSRQLCTQQGVKIIFIDYLGLISSENLMIPRHEQIAEVSRSLKSLARELKIPIVALSQLTRDVEEKRPGLSSIRESGSLEQDADLVMFLHRQRKETSEDSSVPIDTELIIAKQRNGPIGTVPIKFIPMYTSFVQSDKQSRQK